MILFNDLCMSASFSRFVCLCAVAPRAFCEEDASSDEVKKKPSAKEKAVPKTKKEPKPKGKKPKKNDDGDDEESAEKDATKPKGKDADPDEKDGNGRGGQTPRKALKRPGSKKGSGACCCL